MNILKFYNFPEKLTTYIKSTLSKTSEYEELDIKRQCQNPDFVHFGIKFWTGLEDDPSKPIWTCPNNNTNPRKLRELSCGSELAKL